MGSISSLSFTVYTRQMDISKKWQALLQQLQQKRDSIGDVVNTLAILKDTELISQDLKELQVILFFIIYSHFNLLNTSHCLDTVYVNRPHTRIAGFCYVRSFLTFNVTKENQVANKNKYFR